MAPLDTVKLPVAMPPETAVRLACFLTGHNSVKRLDKYFALAMLHASWTSSQELTLSAMLARLEALKMNSSFQALESLCLPNTYVARAAENELPSEQVKAAVQAVQRWGSALRECDANIKAMHTVCIAFLQSALTDSDALQQEALPVLEKIARHSGFAPATPATPAQGGTVQGPNGSGILTHRGPAPSLDALLQAMSQGMSSEAKPPKLVEVDESLPLLQVFDPQEVQTLKESQASNMPGEGNARLLKTLTTLEADQGKRNLVEFKQLQALDELYVRFPHFKEVLDFVRSSLALAACGKDGSIVRIPPILLRGAPGSGKSYFAHELALVLGTPYLERDLSVTSEAFVISGQDSTWKNSKPGLVFDALVQGRAANPLICLNEVDKTKESGAHNSPLSALYTLLEPFSARAFKDEFAPFPVDASRVNWVLTANDGHLPEPILSRLEVFNVPVPTREQALLVAQSVWASVCANELPSGHPFSAALQEEVLGNLPQVNPRLLRKMLTAAAAQACLAHRNELQLADLIAAHARYAKLMSRQSAGFLQ